jgi:hypothetical protein
VVDKALKIRKIIKKMKGVSPEVVIFAILALVIVVAVIFIFSGRLGPGVTQMSKEECKQKMHSVCSAFRSTSNYAVFNDIPKTCADSLGVSSLFTACVSGTTDQCKNLCESVEVGVITPGEAASTEISPSAQGVQP